MKKQKNKKKKLVAAACLALLAVGAGTFAWVSSQDQRVNRMKAAQVKDGSVKVQEEWEPADIIPNTSAKKEVSVTNTGNAPVFVRVSYEEVLKRMTSKGEVTNVATAYKIPATPTLGDAIPVEYNGAEIEKTDSGFTDITNQVTKSGTTDKLNTVTGYTTVKVYGKVKQVTNPLTNESKAELETVIFNKYGDGKYQKMDGNVTTANNLVDGALSYDITKWTFTVDPSSLTFAEYSGGYTYDVANWAASIATGDTEEAKDAKAALLGTAGARYGVDYDYTLAALGITALPAVNSPQTADYIPTQASDQKKVQTDNNGLQASGVLIEYGTDIVAMANLSGDTAKNKWVYNAEDGYFYYTSPLTAGNTTNDLMKKVVFTSEASTKFNNSTYDLVVKMEAVYATKDTLKAEAGWNLNTGTNTGKLVTYLEAQLTN